jgi:tetratricopeptide (TPR) repeat protein
MMSLYARSGQSFSAKTKSSLRLIVFIVLIIVASGLTADARSETEEQAETGKLSAFINQGIMEPARMAQNKGEFERSLALYRRAETLWLSEKYQYSWSKDVRDRFISDALRGESGVLAQMGRYDEAANIYLDLDKRDVSSPGQADRRNAFEAGSIFVSAKLYDKARAVFEDVATSAAPFIVMNARFDLAKIDHAEGDDKKAAAELTQLLGDKRFSESSGTKRSLYVRLKEIYTLAKNTDEANKIEAILQDKHCPKCGSDKHVVPVAYGLIRGMPAGVHLGGCCVSLDSPRWWCDTDQLSF